MEAIRLPWLWAEDRLSRARIYWVCTVLADGRPHSRPVWAVYLEGRLRFSTGSQASALLVGGADVSIQVQAPNGTSNEIVIIEGRTTPVEDPALLARICADYNAKYHYNLEPGNLPGPFLTVLADKVFGWVSDDSGLDGGTAFQGSVTRWRFEPDTADEVGRSARS